MNLDSIAPCQGCRCSVYSVHTHDDEDSPYVPAPDGQMILNVWPSGAWFLQCGRCSYEWENQEDGVSDLPTFRRLSPELAVEIERLRVENARLRRLLRIPPSEVPK